MIKHLLNILFYNEKKKHFFFVISAFSCLLTNAQVDNKRIDSLISVTYSHTNKIELNKVVENGFEIIRLSEQTNYDKGIIEGYFFISSVLTRTGEYKKSLEYLEKIKEHDENFLKRNPTYAFQFYFQKAEVFYQMELPSQTAIYFKEAEKAALSEKDLVKRNNCLFTLYTRPFYLTNDLDVTYQYLLKVKEILETPNYKEDNPFAKTLNNAMFYFLMGNYFYQKNQLEEALIQYNSALKYTTSVGGHYFDGGIYQQIGSVYRNKKQYKEAIEAYEKAKSVFEKYNAEFDINILYANYIKLYELMGDKEQEEKYIVLKSRLADKNEKAKIENKDQSILLLINEKENKIAVEQSKKNKAFTAMIILSILFVIILASDFLFFGRYKKKQNKAKTTSASTSTGKLEDDVLQDRIEIIELAMVNSPDFWLRFQQVYPEFKTALLQKNEKITTSELSIAAYIYLDFTTNEIAEITFRSLRTVENTRYNLRKKLDLSSDINLKDYLKDLLK